MLCEWSSSLCQEYEKKGRSPELPFNPAIALLLCIVVLNRRRAGEGGGGHEGFGAQGGLGNTWSANYDRAVPCVFFLQLFGG